MIPLSVIFLLPSASSFYPHELVLENIAVLTWVVSCHLNRRCLDDVYYSPFLSSKIQIKFEYCSTVHPAGLKSNFVVFTDFVNSFKYYPICSNHLPPSILENTKL